MAGWLSGGGCYNASRWAEDGAGAGARTWLESADVDLVDWPVTDALILSTSWDGDDMNAITADFQLQWMDVTDAGSWTVLSGSGEIVEGSGTDLVNGNAVVDAERLGQDNCSGMGVTHIDGVEREGDNAITMTSVGSKLSFDLQWAIDLSGADADHEYAFRVVEEGTSTVQGVCVSVAVVGVGTLAGITKDVNGDVAVSMFVALFEKIEGTGPPHEYRWRGSQTSDGVTGAYSFPNAIEGRQHFVYGIKEDTPHIFDVTDDVLEGV